MICPKCGAKLVSGTTVCPICGSRQTASSVKKKTSSGTGRTQGTGRTSSASGSGSGRTTQKTRTVRDYDDYDSSYGRGDYEDEYEEEYKPAPKKKKVSSSSSKAKRKRKKKAKRIGLIAAIIVTFAVIVGIVIALLIMLIQQNSNPAVPETLNGSQTVQPSGGVETAASSSAATAAPTEVTTEEISIDESGKTITADRNVYELNDDGKTVTLIQYNGTSTVAILPSEIGGYPVTAIGRNAFKTSTNVQYVKISENVEKLDIFALYDLDNLKEVYIPASVTEIKYPAFGRVIKCITPSETTFAYSYMQKYAETVEVGTTLSVEGNNSIIQVIPNSTQPSSYAANTVSPQQTVPAVVTTPAAVTTAPSVQPAVPSETQPSQSISDPETQPSESQSETQPQPSESQSETQPSESQSNTETQPSESQSNPETQPSESQSETQPQPSESQTETQPSEPVTSSEEQTTTSEAPTEPPTVRSRDSAQQAIAQTSGGTVVDFQYTNFGGDGSDVGFAVVMNADGTESVWFNSPSGTSKVKDLSGAYQSAQAGEFGAGVQYIVSDGSTTDIYQSDGENFWQFASLSGTLNTSNWTLDTGSSVAYLTIQNGNYCEYAAEYVTADQVKGLSGAGTILNLLTSLYGDLSSASFWNRANNMIQVGLANGTYVNLYRVGNGLSLVSGSQVTSGTPEVHTGSVSASYTSFTAISPSALPSTLSGSVTLWEGGAVSYDADGDGSEESVSWSKVLAADGLNQLVLSKNGTPFYTSSFTASDFTVELCDVDQNDSGYNYVIYSTGGASGSRLDLVNGSSGQATFSLTEGTSLMDGMGSFHGIGLSQGHILTDVEGDGNFSILAKNPIDNVSASSDWYVSVPCSTWGANSSSEYDIVDLTGSGNTLSRDVTWYLSANTGDASAVFSAGTWIAPKKLVISGGCAFIYTETPNAGYIYLDGMPIY